MRYVILFFLFASCYGKKPERTGKEGKSMPTFKVLLADSVTTLNTKDLVLKPTVVFVFGPNCPYSKLQMQDLIDNMEKFRNIQILAITPYSFNQMKRFSETYKTQNYSNILIGVDYGNIFVPYISAKGAPYMAIYDSNKKLVTAFQGFTESKQIINAALN